MFYKHLATIFEDRTFAKKALMSLTCSTVVRCLQISDISGLHYYTVKPVSSNHSKIDKTKILMTNGSLMKVKSIAEYSSWSILQNL